MGTRLRALVEQTRLRSRFYLRSATAGRMGRGTDQLSNCKGVQNAQSQSRSAYKKEKDVELPTSFSYQQQIIFKDYLYSECVNSVSPVTAGFGHTMVSATPGST